MTRSSLLQSNNNKVQIKQKTIESMECQASSKIIVKNWTRKIQCISFSNTYGIIIKQPVKSNVNKMKNKK